MKQLMRPILAFITLVALAFAPAVRAAESKPASEIITPTAAPISGQPVIINVDFPGGSVSHLLDAIAKTEGVSLSIIAGNETTDFTRIELPPFSLRNVNLITVVEVMRRFLEARGYDFQPIGGGNANTFVCMVSRIDTPARPNRISPNEFMSFQLAPYLPRQSIEEIVSAIRAGWELDPAHDREALKLKFHPGTSILLVAGPADAIPLTQTIIKNLQRGPIEPENK